MEINNKAEAITTVMKSHNKISRVSPESLKAAEGKAVADVIAPRLKVLFCGINPGLYSAAVKHHFARPGNRFWPALFARVSPRAFSVLLKKKNFSL
jgi:TDG/mug DNA glycosylase family protein